MTSYGCQVWRWGCLVENQGRQTGQVVSQEGGETALDRGHPRPVYVLGLNRIPHLEAILDILDILLAELRLSL